MIDYAKPAMSAEHALKELHWTAIENDFDAAIEHGMTALTEIRLTIQALKQGKDLPEAKIFVCQICGNTVLGEAPEKCPICGAPRKRFEEVP